MLLSCLLKRLSELVDMEVRYGNFTNRMYFSNWRSKKQRIGFETEF